MKRGWSAVIGLGIALGLAWAQGLTVQGAPVTQYVCAGGVSLSLRFAGENAELTFQGQTHALRQRPAASGVQYEGDSFVWYGKGQQGFLEQNGVRVAGACQAEVPSTEVPSTTVPATEPAIRRVVSYLCEGGVRVQAIYIRGQAAVIFKNQTYTLPQVISGSGFRYSDGRAEWRGKGPEASLSSLRSNQVLAQNCREVSMDGVLNGTVTYLARMALPPQAVIQVELQDVSRQDAPAPVLAEQHIMAEGKQIPFPFELRYDASQILPNHSYALRVRITVDGELWFTTTTLYPVLTQGAPSSDVQVRVQPVR
jgi:uncharacterized lipoprotein YbaY